MRQLTIVALLWAATLGAETFTGWNRIRGVNYIPSYGRNLYEIWKHYNHEAFDAELGLAKTVGYDSIRLWLNYFAFAERGPALVNDVEDAVRLCEKHRLKVLIVLFDGCGVRPRPNSRTIKVPEAYQEILASPSRSPQEKEFVRSTYEPYVQGPGRDVLVPYAPDTSPHVLIWQYWQPSPGYDKLDKSWWPKLDAFVQAIVRKIGGHPAVIGFDILNEPEWASEDPFTRGLQVPEVRDRVIPFMRHVREVVKKTRPDAVVTAGFAGLDSAIAHESIADVVSYHVYGEPDVVRASFQKATAFSAKAGKPIFITETLANFRFRPYDVEHIGTDEGQLAHYKKLMPVMMESPIGWMAWGLVVGRIFDSYTDLYYANGHPRPAARYLQQMLKGRK
jgi:hypothetical protein